MSYFGKRHRKLSRSVGLVDRAFGEADSALNEIRDDVVRASNAVRDLENRAAHRDKHLQLVGSIMSAQVQPNLEVEGVFGEFEDLVADYLEESRYDNFPAEADAYADLSVVKSKMARIRLAPRMSRKNIVAVAGGFSSGKSSFINSLIGTEPGVLPTRITPTTSIPTYVHHVPGRSLDISLFNEEGGRVPIDAGILGAITHDFERDYGIPLRKIVNRLVVSTPYLRRFARIVFVDTPGYTNPERENMAGSDEEVALNEILSAHFLVWIIDCDRGALPEGDLDYIRGFLNAGGRKIVGTPSVYIVINKADKKPSDQLEAVLVAVATTAAKHGIQCAGVALYSANEKQWYGHEGISFQAFLDGVNEIEPNWIIKDEVSDVLLRYVEYHQTQADYFIQQVGLLKRLGFLVDAQEKRGRRIGNDLEQAWKSAEREVDLHKRHAAVYRSLLQRFGDCMDQFAKALDGVEEKR